MLRSIFTVICTISVALIVVNIIYNMRNVAAANRTPLSLLTISNVSGAWAWPALAGSYLISESILFWNRRADGRLYHHVFHLAKLEDHGLASKPMVPIPSVPAQDLLQDFDGHPNQEGL